MSTRSVSGSSFSSLSVIRRSKPSLVLTTLESPSGRSDPSRSERCLDMHLIWRRLPSVGHSNRFHQSPSRVAFPHIHPG
jgi:hypothetical protein